MSRITRTKKTRTTSAITISPIVHSTADIERSTAMVNSALTSPARFAATNVYVMSPCPCFGTPERDPLAMSTETPSGSEGTTITLKFQAPINGSIYGIA